MKNIFLLICIGFIPLIIQSQSSFNKNWKYVPIANAGFKILPHFKHWTIGVTTSVELQSNDFMVNPKSLLQSIYENPEHLLILQEKVGGFEILDLPKVSTESYSSTFIGLHLQHRFSERWSLEASASFSKLQAVGNSSIPVFIFQEPPSSSGETKTQLLEGTWENLVATTRFSIGVNRVILLTKCLQPFVGIGTSFLLQSHANQQAVLEGFTFDMPNAAAEQYVGAWGKVGVQSIIVNRLMLRAALQVEYLATSRITPFAEFTTGFVF